MTRSRLKFPAQMNTIEPPPQPRTWSPPGRDVCTRATAASPYMVPARQGCLHSSHRHNPVHVPRRQGRLPAQPPTIHAEYPGSARVPGGRRNNWQAHNRHECNITVHYYLLLLLWWWWLLLLLFCDYTLSFWFLPLCCRAKFFRGKLIHGEFEIKVEQVTLNLFKHYFHHRIWTTSHQGYSPPYRYWSWWVILLVGSGPMNRGLGGQ